MFPAASAGVLESRLFKAAFAALLAFPLLLSSTRAGADIALCVIVVLFLARCATQSRWEWLREAETRALSALWGFLLAAALFSPVSVGGSLIASLIWGRFLLFYLATRFWLLRDSQNVQLLSKTAGFILALVMLDTLWQYHSGTSLSGRPMISDRLTGPLTKANIGNFLVKVAFPVMGMLAWQRLERGQPRKLWLPALGLLGAISIIMVSGERSTPLLMLLSLGMHGLILFIALPALRKWVLLAGAIVVVLLAALAATQPIIVEKAHFFVEQVSDFWNTPYGQLYIAATRLWMQNPLTGIGVQQFLAACQPEVLKVTYCDVHPHNLYFEWLAATGLPGICLFIAAMAVILRRFLRESSFKGNNAWLAACGISGFAVVVFPFVVTQSVFSNWSAMLFWYSLSLAMSFSCLKRNDA